MSGAGKNKKKGKTMTLGEFQSMNNDGTESQQLVTNWAEEMDKQEENDEQPAKSWVFDRSVLPTATKAYLQPEIDLNLVPKVPPFRAHISNISFEADETHVRSFFKELKIDNINLAVNERRNGHRGFGWVDFADRDALISALNKNDHMLNNRKLRVALNEKTAGDRNTGGRDNREGGGNTGGGNAAEQKSDLDSDWRKQPSHDDSGPNDSVDNRPYYHHDQRRSNEGGYQNRYGSGQRGDRGERGGYRQNNNNNNRNNRPNYHQKQNEDGNERPRYEGGGGGRGGYRNRPQRDYNRHSQGSEHAEGAAEPSTPETPEIKERPRLNLQPRTKPLESPEINTELTASSIFGGAKPVDTAARERAIEEKIKAAEAVKQVEEKEEVSAANDDSAEVKSTTASSEHLHQKPFNKQHRADQKFYTAKTKHRNHDSNQSYESNEATSPPPQQQQQQQQHYENRNRNQPHSGQQHNRPPRNYQHSDNNQNTNRFNRSTNEETNRTPHKEASYVEAAPPPPTNAWQKGAASAELFRSSQPKQQQQEEVQQAPVQQQYQAPPPPQQQQPAQDNNNNRPPSNKNYQNRANKSYPQSGESSGTRYNKENKNYQNRRSNDSNNNSTQSNPKKQFNSNNKKGDRNDSANQNRKGGSAGGEERPLTYAQRAFPVQQQQQQSANEDGTIFNKFSKLNVEEGFDEE